MLTPPPISDAAIGAGLHEHFGLRVAQVIFLPLGADANSAVYRVAAADGSAYFLKLRWGSFDPVALALRAFLRDQGIRPVIAPIATTGHSLSAHAHGFDWILYPFFEGANGFAASLSQRQWVALGATVRAVHATRLPADLAARVPREDYAPRWRDAVRAFQQLAARQTYADPTAERFAAFWRAKRDEISGMVERAGRLAQALQNRAAELVVCHSDLHAGNVLVGAGDKIAVVDWDEPILAPKERDLMFVGGGVGDVWNSAQESAWFYAGYGPAEIDPLAFSYYRYERIVADLAAYGAQIFGVEGSAEDREEGLRQMSGQFHANGVVGIAHRTYAQLAQLR